MDFEKLTQETFQINPLSSIPLEDQSHPLTSGIGLLYTIKESRGSFCLKGKVCRSGEEIPEEYFFFKLEDRERAARIRDDLFNRRFPKEESEVFNISDPAPSWWLIEEDHKMMIYFRAPGAREASPFSLGPLGDSKEFIRALKPFQNFLAQELEEIALSDSGIKIVGNPHFPAPFLALKQVFVSGKSNYLTQKIPELLSCSDKRSFWPQVLQHTKTELEINWR